MSEVVETEVKTIEALLSGIVYKLDHYQREYEWGKEHVLKFIDDLTGTFYQNFRTAHAREDVANYSTYFLGNIILFDNNVDNFIIDGQQRLTSLTLLLLYLRSILSYASKSEREAIDELILSNADGNQSCNLDFGDQGEFLIAKLEGHSFDSTGKSSSVRNMYNRYNDIQQHWPNDLSGNKLPYFIDWLRQCVNIVELKTYSEHNAYTIFEATNNRGLTLRPPELLKSYLLSKVDISERSEAAAQWNKTTEKLNEFHDGNSAECIKAWLISKYAQTIGKGSSSATHKDFENIDNMYHVWCQRKDKKNFGLVHSGDFAQFMGKKFDDVAEQFLRIQRASKTAVEGLEHVRYISQLVEPLPYMALLAPIKQEDSPSESVKKIDITARFIEIILVQKIWQNKNLKSTNFGEFQKPMFKIVQEIRDCSIVQLKEYFRAYLDGEGFEFTEVPVLAKNRGNLDKIRHILARLTDFVEVNSKQRSNYEKYIRYSVEEPEESFDVEHILPKSFDSRDKLGGLILLPSAKNSALGSKPYEEKLEHYLEENLLARSLSPECYKRTTDFMQFHSGENLPFEPHTKFDVEELKKRNQLYCHIAEKIWNSGVFSI